MMILAASGMKSAAPIVGSRPCACAEQRLEEVAVVRIAGARTAELETGAPIRRRAKIFARTRALSQLIVGGALLGTFKYLVGLADFLEAGFGGLFLADVPVIFASELAVGLLDLRLDGVPRHAHDLVVDLKLHCTCQYVATGPSGEQYYAPHRPA